MEISENEELMRELGRVYLMAHRRIDRAMTAGGASLARTKFLIYISRHDGSAHAAIIADLFDLAPRTVTEALDALERDGLITRQADPADRRIKRLSITDEGLRAISATEPLRHELMDDICRYMAKEDRANLINSLRKMALAME